MAGGNVASPEIHSHLGCAESIGPAPEKQLPIPRKRDLTTNIFDLPAFPENREKRRIRNPDRPKGIWVGAPQLSGQELFSFQALSI
jgi:hypothetical protein